MGECRQHEDLSLASAPLSDLLQNMADGGVHSGPYRGASSLHSRGQLRRTVRHSRCISSQRCAGRCCELGYCQLRPRRVCCVHQGPRCYGDACRARQVVRQCRAIEIQPRHGRCACWSCLYEFIKPGTGHVESIPADQLPLRVMLQFAQKGTHRPGCASVAIPCIGRDWVQFLRDTGTG